MQLCNAAASEYVFRLWCSAVTYLLLKSWSCMLTYLLLKSWSCVLQIGVSRSVLLCCKCLCLVLGYHFSNELIYDLMDICDSRPIPYLLPLVQLLPCVASSWLEICSRIQKWGYSKRTEQQEYLTTLRRERIMLSIDSGNLFAINPLRSCLP